MMCWIGSEPILDLYSLVKTIHLYTLQTTPLLRGSAFGVSLFGLKTCGGGRPGGIRACACLARFRIDGAGPLRGMVTHPLQEIHFLACAVTAKSCRQSSGSRTICKHSQ